MDLVAVAYVNWGQWVARCPACPHAERAGYFEITDRPYGLGGDWFRCSACGMSCPAVWPPNVDDIWRILSARPRAENRNWEPGETIHDLLAENLMHGVLPAGPLTLSGDRITSGAELLPALPLPAIEGVR